MRSVLVCMGVVCTLGAAAQADVLMIPLAGWRAEGEYLDPGNTSMTVNLPVGTTIDQAAYQNLAYTAHGNSWQSDLAISLNDSVDFISYWDTDIAGTTDFPGSFGPVSAPFSNPGLGNSGPFTLTTGELYIEVYDIFDDPGVDQVISSGTLVITYTVPAPGAAALLAGAGVLAARRRRA